MATIVHRVSLDEFPRRLEADMAAVHRRLVRGMRVAARRGQVAVHESVMATRPYPPADTGRYKASWAVEHTADGAVLYNPLLYAILVELGRRPGRWPPRDVILRWVRRRLRPRTWARLMSLAFLVQRKIGTQGTRGRFVLRRAWPRLQRVAREEVRRALAPGE